MLMKLTPGHKKFDKPSSTCMINKDIKIQKNVVYDARHFLQLVTIAILESNTCTLFG